MLRVVIAAGTAETCEAWVKALGNDPDISIVGATTTGGAAIAAVLRFRPGAVILDARLRDPDVLVITKQLITEAPVPILILCGDADPREADLSRQAREAGALAVAARPEPAASSVCTAVSLRLPGLVKSVAAVRLVRQWPRRAGHSDRGKPPLGQVRPRLVAIAASTGGPAALLTILSGLPPTFPVPILVVQHIAPDFIGSLASWLGLRSPLPVKIAEQDEAARPGTVYLAAADRHLGLGPSGRIALFDMPPVGGFRPSATFLFQSVASLIGALGVFVVLTGMGRDGVEGLRLAHRKGATILAQDEASSVVFGMPAAAAEDGIADALLPLPEIAPRLIDLAMHA